jgi:hypothetical protein
MKNVITTDNGLIHIEFEKTDGTHNLVDAIVVGAAQYAAWTEEEIDEMIQQRWVAYLERITEAISELNALSEGENYA